MKRKVKAIRIAIVLDKRRTTKMNTYPLMLRITYGSKQYGFSIRQYASQETWERITNPKGLRLTEGERELTFIVDSITQKAKEVLKDATTFDREYFIKEFFKQDEVSETEENTDIFKAFDLYCTELRNEKRYSTAISYQGSKRSLQAFIRNELHEHKLLFKTGKKKTSDQIKKEENTKLDANEITTDFLKQYEKTMVENGNSKSTIGMHLRALRAVYRKHFGITSNYPFGKGQYTIPTSRKNKRALVKSDIEKFLSYRSESESENFALDLWKTSFYCVGLNIADVIRLRVKDFTVDSDGTAFGEIIRQKTKNARDETKIEIVLTAKQWLFVKEFLSKNEQYFESICCLTGDERFRRHQSLIRRVNKQLHAISSSLGIPIVVTTYVARHSAATHRRRTGTDIELISSMLGHRSIETTMNYLGTYDKEDKKRFALNAEI